MGQYLNGHTGDASITVGQLRSLTVGISCRPYYVESLEGAQYLTNVPGLAFPGSQMAEDVGLSDLSPLSGLTNLISLDIHGNLVTDLAPLSGLSSLTYLDVSGNMIVDLSPLAGLGLMYLDASRGKPGTAQYFGSASHVNQIVDVSPLAGITSLGFIDLQGNQISDVSALASLPLIGVPCTPGASCYDLEDQRLSAAAEVGVGLPLPPVVGVGTLSWQVTQGDATIHDGTVDYPDAGTVALAFTDSGSTFAGTVTVTVTA